MKQEARWDNGLDCSSKWPLLFQFTKFVSKPRLCSVADCFTLRTICPFYFPITLKHNTFYDSVSVNPVCCQAYPVLLWKKQKPITLRISCHLFLTLSAVNKSLLAEDHKQNYKLHAPQFSTCLAKKGISPWHHSTPSISLSPQLSKAFILLFFFLLHPFPLHRFESLLCAAVVTVAQQWVMETP